VCLGLNAEEQKGAKTLEGLRRLRWHFGVIRALPGTGRSRLWSAGLSGCCGAGSEEAQERRSFEGRIKAGCRKSPRRVDPGSHSGAGHRKSVVFGFEARREGRSPVAAAWAAVSGMRSSSSGLRETAGGGWAAETSSNLTGESSSEGENPMSAVGTCGRRLGFEGRKPARGYPNPEAGTKAAWKTAGPVDLRT
jgi:hypothetical protein